MLRTRRMLAALAAGTTVAAIAAAAGLADAPPVGPLPSGASSTIQTQKGELIGVALPRRANGRVWRIARKFDAKVVQEVSEGDLSNGVVVVVFKAVGRGSTTIAFGLTRGETAKAFESRRYTVRVR